VGSAVRRVDDLGRRNDIAGFLIQEMAHGILEVFAGVSRDPDFGLVLAFGAGGVLIEALDDVALRLLPLRVGDAAGMIAETRVATLLGGFRGRPPGDIGALARALEAVGDFAWAERESLAELDVNPIVVRETGAGCVVVDALIVRAPEPDTGISEARPSREVLRRPRQRRRRDQPRDRQGRVPHHLLGPSGSGKTTTLMMIAGFEERAAARSSSAARI